MMRKGGFSAMPLKDRSRQQKKRIFDLDGIHPGILFGAGAAWFIMFGLHVYRYGARSFNITLWLLPSMMIFGMAILATIVLLRQKEEEEWESRSR